MTFAFVSCYLSIHQVPVCEELYRRFGEDFHYISVDRIPEWRLKSGYRDLDSEYPYVVKAYEDEKRALEIAENCDVLMIGSAPDKYIVKRLKCKKVTFRCSERFYRTRRKFSHFVHDLFASWLHHGRFQNKPLYMLCASAYTACDCVRFGNYRGKLFKWGYFPEVKIYNVDELIKEKRNSVVELLWVGRMIELKHPIMAIETAKWLQEKGINFQLTMIGSGDLEAEVVQAIHNYKLEEYVRLVGVVSSSEVRPFMERANIFLFTSDYGEGWGAVINEAMNSACAVIACRAAGSVPYLIKNAENGFVFDVCDQIKLNEHAEKLAVDRKLCEKMGENACLTISEYWNAKVAVKRLLELIHNDMKLPEAFVDGPCSIASIIYDRK